MGLWITLGIFVLLAVLPLGVRVQYNAEGPLVKAVLGPVRFTVFPRPKKQPEPQQEDTPQEEPAPAQKKKKKKGAGSRKKKTSSPKGKEPSEEELPKPPQAPPEEKKETGGSLTDFLPFVKLGLDFLGDLRRKLRLKELYLRLILAGEDPCDLAVNYGKTWTAVGNLLPALERWFVIQKRDVEVECDFTASETKVIARLEITITLGRIISLAAVYAVRGIKEFIVFRNKRKGGACK